MCLFNKLGRSKAFLQTSQGSIVRSPRVVRGFGGIFGEMIVESNKSPVLLAHDEICDSPDTDLCSSSVPDIGDVGRKTRDNRDNDKSNGDSASTMK